MRYPSRLPIFSSGLGLLTAVILLINVPQSEGMDWTVWLFFAGLVALMLNLGTMLNEGVISPASTAALMAYLTIGGRGSPADAALWSVAVGSLIGNLVWLLRTLPSAHLHREYSRVIRSITVGTAQLTLGLAFSGWCYRQVDGNLPLDNLDESDILPLAVFVVTFLASYLGILFLESYLSRRLTPPMVIERWQSGVQSILLPLPFAAVGAVAYHALTQLAFIILMAGLLMIVTGVNLLSRTQARFRQQVRELSALSVLSQAMRANQDLNALLDLVYEQVTELLNVSNFIVVLYDANRNLLNFPLNVRQHQRVPLESRPVGNGLIEYVIREQQPLFLRDQVPRRAKLAGLEPPLMPVYSWMGVPLLASDRVQGCVVMYTRVTHQQFSRNDLNLLTTITAQAGVAVDNAQLYDQARDRAIQLATLNNVANLLSGTLDAQHVLDLVGASAMGVADCDAFGLYMWWDSPHRPLTLARHNGLSEEFVASPMMPLLVDLDDLRRRRQPVIVTDTHIDQRIGELRRITDREGKRSWIEYLLRKGEELLGILVFLYDEPRSFDADEIELMRNFVNQAALAISNARLYTQTDEALKRRLDQLSALADISRELRSTLNLQGLFQLVLDRALEATQSRTGLLILRTEDDRPELVAHRGFTPRAFDQMNPLTGYVSQTYHTGNATLIPDVTQEDGNIALDEVTRAQLNVPIMRGTELLGVISLGSDRANDYSPDDMSFVTQLAIQARIAIDNARLFRSIEIARDRLQIILDSMKEAVILISPEGHITLANPRVETLLGLVPCGILNVPIVDLLEQPAVDIAVRLGFTRTETLLGILRQIGSGRWDEASHEGVRITFEVAGTDGTRFVDRTDAPVRDDTGRVIGLLMVFSDVTEERELSQARQDLSSMIVHDLRGPLTAITTSLKLLSEIASNEDPLGRAVKQTTEMSSRAVRKLLNLVDSLLDISKLESGVIALDCDVTDLRALSSIVVDEMAPLAYELEVDLTVDVPETLPFLNLDGEKIERVLLNLVDNAIKFTPSGGKVCIRAYPPGTFGVSPGFVRVEVCDTGPGVPDEFKERLFDRFAQLDGQRGRRRGTGLGLTFCRLAVEAHGGLIWIEDQSHGGAVFAFSLPVADL